MPTDRCRVDDDSEEPTVVEVELHLVGERVELLEILGEEALLADRFEAGGVSVSSTTASASLIGRPPSACDHWSIPQSYARRRSMVAS